MEIALRSAEQGRFATEATLWALWFRKDFDCPRVSEGRVMTAALKKTKYNVSQETFL